MLARLVATAIGAIIAAVALIVATISGMDLVRLSSALSMTLEQSWIRHLAMLSMAAVILPLITMALVPLLRELSQKLELADPFLMKGPRFY